MADGEGAPVEGAAVAETAEAPEAGGLDSFDQMLEGADTDFAEGAEDAPADEASEAMDAAEAGEDPTQDLEASPEDEVDLADPEEAPEVEPIHGLEPDAILEAVKEGRIPDELMEHLTITQTIDGQDVPVTLAEARKNGMRLSDYSRRNNELIAQQKEHSTQVDNMVEMVNSWKDPSPDGRQRTRMMLEQWAGDEVILEIARDIADEQVKLNGMGPDGKDAYLRARKAERELQAERQRAQQLERQSKAAEQSKGTETFMENVHRLRDASFKALDIHNNAHTDQLYKAHLRGLWVDRSKPIDADISNQAAQATLEDLGRLRDGLKEADASREKAAAGAKRSKLSPKAASRAGGGGTRQRVKRGSVDTFDQMLGLDT